MVLVMGIARVLYEGLMLCESSWENRELNIWIRLIKN